MLGSDALVDSPHQLLQNDVAQLQRAAIQHESVETPIVIASSSLAKPEPVTDAEETAAPYTDTHWLADFPSVPASRATPACISKPVAADTETEEGLFARLTALKASPAVPAVDMATLTGRLAALKGPKVSAAELPDLYSRLEELKGGKNTVPLSQLEDRLAKLKGTSHASTGRTEGLLIPDFDSDVELNQDQLEALASMGEGYAENTPFETCLAECTVQAEAHRSAEHPYPWVSMPISKPNAGCASGAGSSELQQVLQDFDPKGDDGISEQQLRALASMQALGAAGVPNWAAALGLSTQDLQHGNEPDEYSMSDGNASEKDESSDEGEPCEQGRRGSVGGAAKQAQLKRQIKGKLACRRRQA